MKIELKYDGKDYYDPLFTFFWNEDSTKFAIGIKVSEVQDYNFVIDDIEQNFEKHEVKGTSFFYYTKENVYEFDLEENFNLIPRKIDFSHSIVLLDENGKIIVNNKYKKFISELLE